MFVQVIDMVTRVLVNIVTWFNEVLGLSGMLPFYLAVAFLTLLHAYILYPIFRAGIRSGASDTVRNSKKKG